MMDAIGNSDIQMNENKTIAANVIEKSISDESSSDEEVVETFDKDFLKTLSYLKHNDPIIYNENAKFFNKEEQPVTKKVKKKEKNKPMDYDKLAEQLEEQANERQKLGNYIWSIDKINDLEQENNIKSQSKNEEKEDKEEPFVKKQEKLKNIMKTYWEENDDKHELFTVKEKTGEEKKKDEEDYAKWVKDHKRENDKISDLNYLSVKAMREDEKEKDEDDYIKWLKGQTNEIDEEAALKNLKDYWNNPELGKEEGFLKDYILNNRWKPVDDDNGEETDLSEDAAILDAQNEHESQYNYNNSLEAGLQIKRYPRKIEGAYRKKDDRRKQKRKIAAEKKISAKKMKIQEIKKAQKEKLLEIKERVAKLKEAIGNDSLGFDDNELFGSDFESEKYDEMMEKLYGDDFYEEDALNDEEVVENEPKMSRAKRKKEEKKKKKQNKKLTLEDVVNPEEENFEEYAQEYYKMEFEDIKGDIPCRYKYDQVTPNNYGLTFEEILMADDKELNKWVDIKKMYMRQPENIEKDEAEMYLKRGENESLKVKILPSLFVFEDNPEQPSTEQKSSTSQKPKVKQNNINKPKDKQNNINKPKEKQNNINKPKEKQNNINKPKVKQNNINKPKVKQNNINKPKEKQNIKIPKVKQNNINKPKEKQNCTPNDNQNDTSKPKDKQEINDKQNNKKKTNDQQKSTKKKIIDKISNTRLLAYNIHQPKSFRSKVLQK